MASGQVTAKDEVYKSIHGFPTESKFAGTIKPLPDGVKGKTIGDGTSIGNVTEAGQVIKLSIERGRWKFLKFEDTLSLVDSAGEPFAGGAYLKDFSNVIGKSRIILFDKDDKPICLAVQELVKINKVYTIYGLKPLLDGDAPAEKHDGIDFYPWFKVRDIDDSHLDFRSMLVWNGKNFQPMIRIYPNERPPTAYTGDLLPPNKSDNTVCDSANKDNVYALMSKKSNIKERRWDVCIGPGSDAVAMIMLAAIMDDMVEWFA